MTRIASPGVDRVVRSLIVCGVIMTLAACRSNSPHAATGGRNLSPHEVSFSDIAIYATRGEVERAVRPLVWTKDGTTATWRPGKKEREREGIDEVRITFKGEKVRGIEARYAQIFDVQYRGVNRMVRERYGPSGSESVVDSVQCIWKYDSLTVTLTPNRKQHWTGSFYVFTPVLNLEETLRHAESEKNE